MYKFSWDRDYHTMTGIEEVKKLEDIEDDWTGYNYYYSDSLDCKPWYSAEEARKKLANENRKNN